MSFGQIVYNPSFNLKSFLRQYSVEKNKNDCIFIELKALEQIDEKAIDEKIKEGYMEHYSMKQYNNELYKYKNGFMSKLSL